MLRSRAVFLACFVTFSLGIQAAPLTYFGEDVNGNPLSRVAFPNASSARSTFLGQLPGSSTDNLEGLAPGTLTPIPLTFSGIASTLVTGGNAAVRNLTTGTDGFGEYPTSGNSYIASDSNAALTVTFSSPVTSFGFYGIDVGDFATAHLVVSVAGASGTIQETVNNIFGGNRGSAADGAVLFFGYINAAAPFTSVQISSPNDSFAFDDPVIGIGRGTAAPEPAYFGLLTCGFMSICLQKLTKLEKNRA